MPQAEKHTSTPATEPLLLIAAEMAAQWKAYLDLSDLPQAIGSEKTSRETKSDDHQHRFTILRDAMSCFPAQTLGAALAQADVLNAEFDLFASSTRELGADLRIKRLIHSIKDRLRSDVEPKSAGLTAILDEPRLDPFRAEYLAPRNVKRGAQ